MSTDDLLRDRLRSAADAAGAHADTSAAMRLVDAGPPPPAAGPKLWLLSAIAVVALAAGTLAGATVLSPGDGDAAAADQGGGIGAAAERPTDAPAQMVGAAFDCPGGAPVGQLRAGDRVFVVGRDESGAWSAIRDPQDVAEVVWVETAALAPDAAIDVDVLGCDEPTPLLPPTETPESTTTTTVPGSTSTTVAVVPKPGVVTTVAPSPPPGTAVTTTAPTTTTTAPDTQAPTLQVSASRTEIYQSDGMCTDVRRSQLTALATDDVGVASVTAAYSGLPGSPLTFTRTGGSLTNGTWTATFGPFNSPTTQDLTITVIARDAAGNTSASQTVQIKYWAMGCLG